MRAALGDLSGFEAKWHPGASVCVVIASKGYPGNPQTGVEIRGLDDAAKVPGAVVFHAGTRGSEPTCYTNGGRVLVVSAMGEDLEGARSVAYDAASRIKIEGAHYRKDIGAKATRKRALL
jgi:phosphoribosylamine--glycine ligase